MKKRISNARTSSIRLFSEIVKENHRKMTGPWLHKEKIKGAMAKTAGEDEKILLEQELNSIEKELTKSSLIVISFSAMAVEAYIYDYAARHLGDDFVKDHLDKLDTASKWIVIPKLITGKELPSKPTWLELLKSLIKTRNSIIHYKTLDGPGVATDIRKYLKKLDTKSELLYKIATQSVDLLSILADKIAEIDPEETPWVQSYLA